MFFFNRSNSSSKIIQHIFGIPFFSNSSRFIALLILILFPTINNSQQPSQNSTSSQILETSSPFSDLVPHLATEAVEVPASILDGNTDQPLEQYFWEKVHRREDCPLNCTTNSSSTQTQQLQCWRLSGYLIPFICLPTDFDPNSPFSPNGRQGTKNWLQWILSLTNAELIILALLFLNTFVGISTCICVCARRKCLGDKF